MDYEIILYEERGPVAVITLNRPEVRNAMNVPMYREVTAAVEAANANDHIGAIVITNTGNIFCAGVDFKAPPEPRDPDLGYRPTVATIGMADDVSWLHLMARSKPSIMAISGAAIGMGATFALAADIRMGGASSSFTFPFVARGTMPEFGGTALLPRIVGFGRAMDICLSAAAIDAEECLRIGLITRLVADGDIVDEAVKLGEQLAGTDALAMRLTKDMLYANATESDLNALLTVERDTFVFWMKQMRAAQKENQRESK